MSGKWVWIEDGDGPEGIPGWLIERARTAWVGDVICDDCGYEFEYITGSDMCPRCTREVYKMDDSAIKSGHF